MLVIGVSAGTALHVPIRRAAWPILIFCCGLVVLLAIRSRRPVRTVAFNWQLIASSGLIVGTVVVVLWGSLVKGEFVSVYPDPWAYTAFATYVQDPVQASSVGSQPILSFGLNLMKARYGTAGLLAWWATISGTDACRSASIYALLILVHTGLGLALFARLFGAGRILSIGAGIFGVSVGWAPEILKIGNWDQFLFLGFLPFLLVRIRLCTLPTSRLPGILALGLSFGAAIFVYPEGVAMAGVIYLPLLFWRVIRGSDFFGKLRRLAVAVGLALLVSSAYLPLFVIFLRRQIHSGTHVLNAEGVMPGLLSSRWLPAAYGLGEHAPIAGWKKTEIIVPMFFLGLSLLALGAWWRKKDGILLTVPIFFLLTIWQVVLLKYDYGFYKILTMFWPVMIGGIFVGMSRVLAWSPKGLARSTGALAFCGIMVAALFDENVNFQYAPWRAEREIQPFLELKSLKKIFGNAPICIQTQSWFNQMWAVFFLRGDKLVVPRPLGYLRHSSSGLKNVTTELGKETFLLSDEKRRSAVWFNKVFSLQNHLDPIELMGIDAPNVVETVQGDTFLWLNNQFADFTIHSDASRQALLTITECWPGPSRPGDKHRTLIVEVNGKRVESPALSKLEVPLRLNQGFNLVRLSCKETPTTDKLSSGDTRTLLLGIKGFAFVTRENPVELVAIDAPNGVETVQSDPFVWLDNRGTDLTLDSDAERQAVLTIRECWLGPSRPGETMRTLIVEVNGKKTETPIAPNLKVPLNLRQGSNLVRLSCKETPTVDKLSSGDTRTLLLGIKGFRVSAAE